VLAGGRDLFIRPQFCNQIVYADISLDIADFSERELLLLPFYTRLVQMTGMGELSYVQVATKLKHLTGDFNLFVEMGSSCNDEDVLVLLCRAKMLVEDFEEAMHFIQRLLFEVKVDDLKQIKQVLNNYKTDFADSITTAPTVLPPCVRPASSARSSTKASSFPVCTSGSSSMP
jgi:Zn-dependent M16 (insulinase) family peptidase